MRIVALCGSLRRESSNLTVLRAMQFLARTASEGPAPDFVIYEGLAALPHFNPDLDEEGMAPPAAVAGLRTLLIGSDAIVISSPEYAHGVAGSLKNALDWLVSTGELVGRPVGVVNASFLSTHAHAALLETLRTMNWGVVPGACVTLPRFDKRAAPAALAADPAVGPMLHGVLSALANGRGGEDSPLSGETCSGAHIP